MSWRDHAACRPTPSGLNPHIRIPAVELAEAFFEPSNPYTEELAKQVCDHCPVRTDCLAEALNDGLDDGIWGGLTAEERRALRRAKTRAA